MKSRTAWLIFAVLLSSAAGTHANPFSRAYNITLRDIDLNGDLSLSVPLAKLSFGNDGAVDVWLEHKQEVIPYGTVRSHFYLRPFETELSCTNVSTVVWTRPGGGEVVFQIEESRPKQRATPYPISVVSQGATLVLISGTEAKVLDDGWELDYASGALQTIRTPSGAHYSVGSVGRRLTSLSKGDQTLAAILWEARNLPQEIRIGRLNLVCSYQDGLQLSFVKSGTQTICSFNYDSNGLLEQFSHATAEPLDYRWSTKRKPEGYQTPPFVLLQAGDTKYDYKCANDVVEIRATRPSASPERLRVKTLYGRLVSVQTE